ncbi:MAG: type II secretion system protein [Verrucomicrobia bacterium]|nr:type II secretion system protein [Verrucomicrobiota bacterium]MBS0646283.1 type II secretion system protein [Verrucomicrobiota bacterium]
MIVILLIGLIGGALAFNMRGSLDQGKVFKTEQTQLRIHDILMLEYAKGDRSLAEIASNWQSVVRQSALIKQGSDALVDAWHKPFIIQVSEIDDDLLVKSTGLEAYHNKHAQKK